MDFFRSVENRFPKQFRLSRTDEPPDTELRASEFETGVADRVDIRRQRSADPQKKEKETIHHFPLSQMMSLA